MNPGDALRAAEEQLAEATDRYLTLAAPEWREAGSTRQAAHPDEHRAKTTKLHAPVPINVNVVDYLAASDEAATRLAADVRAWLTDPTVDPATVEAKTTAAVEAEIREAGVRAWHGPVTDLPARARPGSAPAALNYLSKALPSLPPDVAEAVLRAAYDMSREAARLLGLERPRAAPVTVCPYCRARSIILSPADDDLVLCGNPECVPPDDHADCPCDCHPGGLDAACSLPGGCGLRDRRSEWRRSAGEWTALGWSDEALLPA